MIYKAEYKNGVICLPERTGEILTAVGDGELRVLVYVLLPENRGKDLSEKQIAELLKLPTVAVEAALDHLCSTGILSREASSVKVREHISENGNKVMAISSSDSPHYTGAEIEALFRAEPMLGDYIGECQRILGKMLSALEINKLLSLREYYGLDPEYVILLCGYCKEKSKGTVPYIEKTAKSLIDKDITSVEGLEERLAYLRQYDGKEAFVRRLFGMKGRALTQREKKFIEKWTELDIDDEIIELAYEVAVNNTGAPSMPYMNKVILNWKEAGYTTKEEVFSGIENYRKKKESESSRTGSFDTDEFFEAALKRTLEKHGISD